MLPIMRLALLTHEGDNRMIDTTNLTVPAKHGSVKAHRLSLRSKTKMSSARRLCESKTNLAGGERHYDQPIVVIPDMEERHLTTELLLSANKVDISFNAEKGVYPLSQDLQDAMAVSPKPKKKPKTRVMKEPEHVGVAPKLTEHVKQAGAKGARPRSGSKSDPIESIPSLGMDAKKVKVPDSVRAKEEAKFRAAIEAWKAAH